MSRQPRSTCNSLFVGRGQIRTGHRRIGGAQQPFPVVVGFPGDRGPVDAQQPAGGAPQVPFQPGRGFQGADELVTPPRGPVVRAGDLGVQMGHELVADGGIAGGLVKVVADDEALRTHPAITVTVPTRGRR